MIEYFNEDCMEGMKRYPDKYFDLAIVDPPYGIGQDGQRLCISNGRQSRKYHPQKKWDAEIPSASYFQEVERISRNRIIWGGNYFTKHLPPQKSWIFWYKGQQGLTMSDGELAWTSFDDVARMVTFHRSQLWIEHPIHPTQKPVRLYKWILQNYAHKGDRILDTHVGSASSLIACYDLGFDAVGFELDPDYYAKSKQRLEDFMRQPRLAELPLVKPAQIELTEQWLKEGK